MNCDICGRAHQAKKLPFLCAVDARNELYEGRFQIATALMRNDKLAQDINGLLAQAERGDGSRDPRVVKLRLDELRSTEEEAADRTSKIIAQADKLKKEIDAARKEIAERKESIARRKSDLDSASDGLTARRTKVQTDVEMDIRLSKYRWNRDAVKMAAFRSFLCEEAARLYGLRQVIKKGGTKRYEIGGIEIIDLAAMHKIEPQVISASLAHIAHILVLASHYLAIRLPAEITLPHRDYPRPTIFNLSASYRHGELPFPGPSGSVQVPADAQEGDASHIPTPRALFLDKPLAALAKEDPAAYSKFLEGVSLLSYDIAWACLSQGVSIGDRSSTEDVFNIGQNLWKLLIGESLHRKSAEPVFPSTPTGSPREADLGDLSKPQSQVGRWSHGTAHAFLGGAEGSAFMRDFKLPSTKLLADRLKKRLLNEAAVNEWDNIDKDEVRNMVDDDEGVMIRGRGGGTEGPMSTMFGVESIATVAATNDTAAGTMASARGSSGWTKLKSR